jgi:hypothetical protein
MLCVRSAYEIAYPSCAMHGFVAGSVIEALMRPALCFFMNNSHNHRDNQFKLSNNDSLSRNDVNDITMFARVSYRSTADLN